MIAKVIGVLNFVCGLVYLGGVAVLTYFWGQKASFKIEYLPFLVPFLCLALISLNAGYKFIRSINVKPQHLILGIILFLIDLLGIFVYVIISSWFALSSGVGF